MTGLDAVRARFARNRGASICRHFNRSKYSGRSQRTWRQFRDRVFSPATTIWGFLSQVLSEDHSCRDAVSRIIAHRAANGDTVCSPNTASYCNARSRILTKVLSTLATRTAEELQASIAEQWKWNGRSVFIFDGSTVSMPDTPLNQAMYPQPPKQKPGLGFPLARIGVLLSLATGACHNLAIAAYSGKGTGEISLFRRMYDTLKPGDVVVADALFDNYFIACELRQRGIDIVARVQHDRVGSWTKESRPDGDILVWQRPGKPRGMTGAQYRSYPEQLTMRQVTVDAATRTIARSSSKSLPRFSMCRSMASRLAIYMIGGGMERSIYGRSSQPCRWTSSVARHRRWFTKRFGLTCWLTTYSAQSWPLPPTRTTSTLAR